MVHVLIEVSGGVVTNVLVDGGEVTVWLRDYDDLREEGISGEEAEERLPTVFDGFGDEIPPASFTKRPDDAKTRLLKQAIEMVEKIDGREARSFVREAEAAIANAEVTPRPRLLDAIAKAQGRVTP